MATMANSLVTFGYGSFGSVAECILLGYAAGSELVISDNSIAFSPGAVASPATATAR